MKIVNNQNDVNTDQLIEIAVQAANAKRHRPRSSENTQSVNPNTITNSAYVNENIMQEVGRWFSQLEYDVSNNQGFKESAKRNILTALASLKDDIAKGKLRFDFKTYSNFHDFAITHLFNRIKGD